MSLLARKLARDTRRQWRQFGAVALTLALGVAVFGAAYDSYDNLRTSYRQTYERLRFAHVTVTGGNPAAIAAAAAPLDGVAAVTTRRQADVPFRLPTPDGPRTLLGRVVGEPAGSAPAVNRLLVEEGRGLAGAGPASGSGARTAVAERHMADHFGLRPGDEVEVFGAGRWQPLTVAGVAVSPEYLWPARSRQDLLTSPDDFGVLFVPDPLVATLAGGAVEHQTLVHYADGAPGARLDRRVAEMAAAHGAGDVMFRDDHPSHGALQQDVDAFAQLAVLFPLLFLGAGALAAYVLLGRLVRSQRGEIGMLAANGYPRRRLLRHYLGYGAAAGAAGSLAGAAGGVALASLLTGAYASSLGIPLAVARFHPATPAAGVLIGTLAGMLSAAGPARAAVRVTPAEAMRGPGPAGTARRSALERLPGLRSLPVRARLLLRNLARHRRRSLSTGAGVVFAAVLVLASLGMLDTVSLLLEEQFHDIQREDAQLYLAGPSGPGDVAGVEAVTGVAAAEAALEVPVVLSAGGERYQTVLTGFASDTVMHRFAGRLPADGLVFSQGLGSILGVDSGERVDVGLPGGSTTSVPVAGSVDEPLGSVAYSSRSFAARLAGENGRHSLLVRYAEGADRAALRERLAGRPGVVAFRDIRGTEEAVAELMELFYVIVGLMLAFGAVLAFVVLFNTLSVNLSERTVELATLRAAGARLRTLAWLVTGEHLLLVALAVPFGLAAGWAVARWFMSSFDSDLYHFTLRLRPATPVLLAAALLGVTLLTHIPARRTLRRLDVARVVRERAL